MSPKKKASQNACKLEMPIVSEKDLKDARLQLASESEVKKQRSNMSYYLQQQGHTDAYKAPSTQVKRQYLDAWFAQRLGEQNVKKALQDERLLVATTRKVRKYSFMAKAALIREFGEEKATHKMAVLGHRPDPDTQKDGEWDREFKVFFDEGGDIEEDTNQKRFQQIQTLENPEQIKEAMSSFVSAAENMGGNVPRAS
jgi:hypothetical protein